MSNIAQNAVDGLRLAILNAIDTAKEKGQLGDAQAPDFVIETPADRSHGDLATNAAMACAKAFKMPPFKIAQAITANLTLEGTYIERFETAGPGFINFFLKGRYYSDVIKDIEESGDSYGRSSFGQGKKVMVEFVSANPTGPMHMGNARGGALGDCLAAVLDAAGYNVWREFYVNDAGNQIEKFAMSLEARYLQLYKGEAAVEFPEDGYQGADIMVRAKEYADTFGDNLLSLSSTERKKALVDFALPRNITKMQNDMKKYRIEYDKWFFESELHSSGYVTETIDILKNKGMTYEKDGALWYKNIDVQTKMLLADGKSQDYIDKLELKDDVLIRQNGSPTYFAADIAYHRNKFEKRGYTTCIDVWGADHHGHVARMKGAINAVGLEGDKLDVVLMQLVRLVRDNKPVKMSKRTGKAIQLADLLDEVPVDAARFLFNMREANTQMDFDLTLAVTEDSQNPVYYVQYAYARICSIIKSLQADGIAPRHCNDAELALLTAPEERELIHHLADYTNEIISAAKDYDPTKVTRYVLQLATLFHKFYNACRVKGEDKSLTQARLSLCLAIKSVIKNVLTMLKITAPESM
ncbi:MAG TPA: arginine--tRNA ligase [Clostridiales bacterium]|nr:arginine--tRNA ligase [Clostridiales bacterium]